MRQGKGTTVLYAQGRHLYKDRVEHLGLPETGCQRRESQQDTAMWSYSAWDWMKHWRERRGDTGNSYSSGDKEGLELPASQRRLMEEILALDKPVIVCNMTGSAVDLSLAQEKAGAVIQAWYPGAEGGTAFARLIFGRSTPGGKLPVTFYKDLSALPEFEGLFHGRQNVPVHQRRAPLSVWFGLTYGKGGIVLTEQ